MIVIMMPSQTSTLSLIREGITKSPKISFMFFTLPLYFLKNELKKDPIIAKWNLKKSTHYHPHLSQKKTHNDRLSPKEISQQVKMTHWYSWNIGSKQPTIKNKKCTTTNYNLEKNCALKPRKITTANNCLLEKIHHHALPPKQIHNDQLPPLKHPKWPTITQ